MFNIKVSQSVHETIHDFILSYKNVFVKLFEDTGIYNASIIREHYIQNSELFQNNLYDKMYQIIVEEVVFGRKGLGQNIYEIYGYVDNFQIIMTYREDISNKIRYVEHLIIQRK